MNTETPTPTRFGFSAYRQDRSLGVGVVTSLSPKGAILAVRREYSEADRVQLFDPKTGEDIEVTR